jgi:hypothetical protein
MLFQITYLRGNRYLVEDQVNEGRKLKFHLKQASFQVIELLDSEMREKTESARIKAYSETEFQLFVLRWVEHLWLALST